MAHSNTTTSQIRNEWYQTDQEIVLSVFIRNTRPEDLVIITNQQSVSITHKPSSSSSSDHPHPSPQLLIDPLSHDIDPTRSTWKCFPSKIELKLFKKVQGINWKSLQRPKPLDGSNPDLTPQLVIAAPTTDSSQKAPIYPSSSKKKTDWDRLANSLEKEDQQEIQNSGDPNSGGDRALNELFQKLYADATDDQRRAMMKSYTESNGTALSTDWEDVKKKKVETKPPQSMVAKPWEK